MLPRKIILRKAGFLGAFLLLAYGCAAPYAQLKVAPDYGAQQQYTQKVADTPDYMQTDPAFGGFPWKGRMYCAPASVSNALMWLAEHGYPKLAPDTGDRKKDQHQVILELGRLMNANPRKGAGPRRLTKGIEDYVTAKGYQIKRLQYQGWRPHFHQYSTGVIVPQLGWIRKSLENKGVVILGLGWYRHDPGDEDYLRVGGHYVTLVGYGHQEGRPYFIVHDPSPRTGPAVSHDRVTLKPIPGGTMVGRYRNLPQNAAGFYLAGGELRINPKGNTAILDGAIALELMAP
jgi:hypothetical protein